jgi:DNA helicase-2/ATP-dependent DNA helicase PcrA
VGGKPRLPRLIKQQLAALSPPIDIFNPRGEDLTELPLVRVLGGLLLECLDPAAEVEQKTRGLSNEITDTFQIWRSTAIAWADSSDCPPGLKDFAIGWAERTPARKGWQWPKSVPVIDLLYALVHFFPQLYDDPEGQIYLEVFTRQLEACEQVGRFEGRVVTDPTAKADDKGVTLPQRSVMELLRDFLGPIASGTVKVNQELVQSFPRSRLSILSIHQAKGLEFPLTIVDVGSDFRTNSKAQAFKRFPTAGGQTEAMEDLLRPFTPMGPPTRTPKDRAFDDLYRHFFVAYSRPQEVLLLVGLRTVLPGGGVATAACGYDRKGRDHWAKLPLLEI